MDEVQKPGSPECHIPSSEPFKELPQSHIPSITHKSSFHRGQETPTHLGPLERATLNHWTPHLKTETDPVSETLCSSVFLEYQTMDKVQKPNTPGFSIVA
jgi:hypothetical protein